MPEAHSEWSASGFKQVMLCPGSKVLQLGRPNNGNIYSAEGTAAHELLEMVLTGDTPAAGYEGRIIEADGFEIEVNADMVRYVQQVADQVREYQGADGVLMCEQKLYYGEYLSVPRESGWGTGDIVIARGEELIVGDLKYGRGVEVDVERNPQLMLYGLGALEKLNGIAGDFERVRLVIFQPRITSAPSEWDISVEELEAWGRSTARSAVATAKNAQALHGEDSLWEDTFLRPGEEQCRFCKAKATCPKLIEEVAATVHFSAPLGPDEFVDLDPEVPGENTPDDVLAVAMSKIGLIEDWCTAVRAEVERRLLDGKPVPGFKLVQGKQGNRAWTKKAEVEEVLKSMRLKQEEMYEMSLISPTAAEKLLAKDSPRRWSKLQSYITRAEGKPSVAPLSDKRPALEMKPVADDFTEVAETFDDLV